MRAGHCLALVLNIEAQSSYLMRSSQHCSPCSVQHNPSSLSAVLTLGNRILPGYMTHVLCKALDKQPRACKHHCTKVTAEPKCKNTDSIHAQLCV